MKQEVFETRHSATWDTLEGWIDQLERSRFERNRDAPRQPDIGKRYPELYRAVCHHLALAKNRRYGLGLQQRLNKLALRGHRHLYRTRSRVLAAGLRLFTSEFPRCFRRNWRFLLLSSLLFYLPGLLVALAISLQSDLVYAVLDPQQVRMMESMYDPDNESLGRVRDSETDLYMFGVYIYNNISIGFQTFAGGLLFGLGSLFYLIFNGVFFGTIATHLTLVGLSGTLWPFVVGHSSLELTAITIFGAVGLMIGFGALAPGRKKRWHAIRDRAMDGLPLIYGATLMLVLAAFVEAFWSSTTWPPAALKYTVGAVLWLVVAAYFGLMGGNES